METASGNTNMYLEVLGTKAFSTAPCGPRPCWVESRGGGPGLASLSRTAPQRMSAAIHSEGHALPHTHARGHLGPSLAWPSLAAHSQHGGSSPWHRSPLTSAPPAHHIIPLGQAGQLAGGHRSAPGRGPCGPIEEKPLSFRLCQGQRLPKQWPNRTQGGIFLHGTSGIDHTQVPGRRGPPSEPQQFNLSDSAFHSTIYLFQTPQIPIVCLKKIRKGLRKF